MEWIWICNIKKIFITKIWYTQNIRKQRSTLEIYVTLHTKWKIFTQHRYQIEILISLEGEAIFNFGKISIDYILEWIYTISFT